MKKFISVKNILLILLLPSLLLIFQWFNPFAWIYRREIESNLEFLTDDQLVQQKNVDKKTLPNQPGESIGAAFPVEPYNKL